MMPDEILPIDFLVLLDVAALSPRAHRMFFA
jgi:hypothetical protein